MPAPGAFGVWPWAVFVVGLLLGLALDLGFFHRSPEIVKPKEALLWSAFWLLLAMAFAGGLALWRGKSDALEFITGYFVEYTLSMDNVAVIASLFAFFGIAARFQHRVLFWGIFGALLMRGAAIGLGVALIRMSHWVLCIMGAFLVYTGLRWAFAKNVEIDPQQNVVLRLARRFFPVAQDDAGGRFMTWKDGRRVLTPLALAMVMIEVADLLFAVDSIPAVFAVTQNAFIVFTSNCFAILGLRSLYFVVAGAMANFRFLKTGLAAVLIFVGAKMLAARWYELPIGLALAVVIGIIASSIVLSLVPGRKERRT